MSDDLSTTSTDAGTPAPVVDGSAAAQASSTEAEEPKGPNFFDRIFRPEKTKSEGASGEPKGETRKQSQPSAQKREYTDDEFKRAVQSETDRREAKRTAEQKEADKLKLREEDPYAYVDQEKAEEQQRQAEERFGAFLGDVGRQFDGALLEPVMQRLPESERTKLLADDKMGVGLEGRKALMDAALELLFKQAKTEGKTEAEAALRKNPAFRKQLLGEFRGSPEHEEPDLVPANGAVGNATGMNDWMRGALGKSRYRPSD